MFTKVEVEALRCVAAFDRLDANADRLSEHHRATEMWKVSQAWSELTRRMPSQLHVRPLAPIGGGE